MSANHSSNGDYDSLKSKGKKKGDARETGLSPLKSRRKKETDQDFVEGPANLTNFQKEINAAHTADQELPSGEAFGLKPKNPEAETGQKKPDSLPEEAFLDRSREQKEKKKELRSQKDLEMLSRDSWVTRNGHYLTYIGLYCFSIMVLYRPYELVPSLGFLSTTAFYIAVATLAIFIPTQLATEGTLSYLSLEVKLVLLLTLFALISVPIAKSRMTAWAEFNDIFIKAVLMFVVMVNVLRTRRRLNSMIGLSLGIAIILSYQLLGHFIRGELDFEGYRAGVNVGGMFGNPNDLALHLVMMVPLAVTMGAASKNPFAKLAFFGITALFVAGISVTYSRGGFLGLVVASGFLIWKLSRKNRMQVIAVAAVAGILFILFAPGNYGMRLLSIFDPSLDGVGSRNQRRDLLYRSILVSIRNPWGIGIGNFPIVGIRNLVTHNSYTQVSSELGVLGLLTYLGFLISPFKKLAAIERRLRDDKKHHWYFCMAVGLQASLISYMVSSFFVSVAYGWFIYYMVAYAVAFRRIYMIDFDVEEEAKTFSLKRLVPGWQS